MADEALVQAAAQTDGGNAESANAAEQTTAAAVTQEKMISKAIFDSKVSEMNKTIKALKDERLSRLSEDERAAEEKDRLVEELKAAREEAARLRITSDLMSFGLSADVSESVVSAIVGADEKAIVAAFKEAITVARTEAAANAKQELLKAGAAKVGVAEAAKAEKADPKLDRVKSAVRVGNAGRIDNPWLK